jgi:NAD(P)H-hydrate epimerase
MEKIKTLSKSIVHSLLKKRKKDSNKGTYGHALLIVGSQCKMGAAVIAAKACLRSGVGLLTVNIPKDERFIMQTAIPEAMLQFREGKEADLEKYTAIGIGSGVGVNKKMQDLLSQIITHVNKTLVIDADALTIISTKKKMLESLPNGTIITPHVIEFDRLFGSHKTHESRIQTAIEKSQQYGIVIVLKNYQTLITYNGISFINKTGNSGLAKGGSGDALTGIITSFLAQGYTQFEAAKISVYLHGLAADFCLKQQSVETMLITDVIENLADAFKKLQQ